MQGQEQSVCGGGRRKEAVTGLWRKIRQLGLEGLTKRCSDES